MAKFQKGHKFAKGGKRNPPGGRPTKEQKEIERKAADLAREYIERSVKPVMHSYFQLAHGRLVNKYHEGVIIGQEFEVDAPTTRHFVDKLVPEAAKTLEVKGQIGIDDLLIRAAERKHGSRNR